MPTAFGTLLPASDPRNADRAPKQILLECLLAWLFVSVATTLLDFAGHSIPLLRQNLVAVVAILFLLTPRFALPRHIAEPTPPTQGHRAWRTTCITSLAICSLTTALYLPGRHLWETNVSERQFQPGWSTLFRPPGQCLGQPPTRDVSSSTVHIGESHGSTVVTWHTPDEPWQLRVEAYHPLQRVRPTLNDDSNAITDQGRTARLVQLAFRPLRNQSVTVTATVDRQPAAQFVCGASSAPLEGNPLTLHFSLSWLLMLIATHWLLVALPEEFFYRGYLQPRLQRWPSMASTLIRVAGLQVTGANVATSSLFAVAHFIVGGDPFRLAVFFPSLLFGALRDRTGTIATPLLFHAFCNILAHISGLQYA
jgi:membrane protease YdiL (CAAX protease family)